MEIQSLVAKKPLIIIDLNRYITQKEYCAMFPKLTLQNLQNMIKRNQVKSLHIKEFGLTLVDMMVDDKETVEMEMPKGALSRELLGECMTEWAISNKNKLQEMSCLVDILNCELTKQKEIIKQDDDLIEKLEKEKKNLGNYCDQLATELEEKESVINTQLCELTTQNEIITQNSLVITELEGKIKILEAVNAKTTDIQDIKENMARFSELLSGFQLPKNDTISTSETPQEQEELWFVQYGVFLQPSNKLQTAIHDYFYKDLKAKDVLIKDKDSFLQTIKDNIESLNLQHNRCKAEKFAVHSYHTVSNSFSLCIGEKVVIRFTKVKNFSL